MPPHRGYLPASCNVAEKINSMQIASALIQARPRKSELRVHRSALLCMEGLGRSGFYSVGLFSGLGSGDLFVLPGAVGLAGVGDLPGCGASCRGRNPATAKP